MPLIADPGACFSYGIGIDWAGQMVEAASGQRLGEYLRQHVLDPLGMPVATQVVSGEKADDPLYVPAIAQVRQGLGQAHDHVVVLGIGT